MRIVLVVDETPFYLPNFVDSLCEQLSDDDQIVSVLIVKSIPDRSNLEKYLMRNWTKLRLKELLYFAFKKVQHSLILDWFRGRIAGCYYSVEAVCRGRGIPFQHIHNTINDRESIRCMRKYAPDVIISSNSLFFGPELLSVPRLGCVNRHSSLLPSYGGLWPVLHAIACGEKEVGVTAHMMTPQIDEGAILAQKPIPVLPNEPLTRVYEKCFIESVPVILSALQVIRSDRQPNVESSHPASYYSFPTDDQWRAFRRHGGRFV